PAVAPRRRAHGEPRQRGGGRDPEPAAPCDRELRPLDRARHALVPGGGGDGPRAGDSGRDARRGREERAGAFGPRPPPPGPSAAERVGGAVIVREHAADHERAVPRHIAVIPDGNRRYARKHALSNADGYMAG